MKVCLVTGSTGNMGQAVVNKFLNEGFSVVGSIMPGEKIPSGMEKTGFEARAVDLMNEESAGMMVEKLLSKYNSLDAAVLTVGGFAMGKISETGSGDILKQYKLNFETAYHVARPVFAQMMKQGHGRIFLIGSRPGIDAGHGKGMVAYGLAKSLIFRLADLMNEEAKGQNVVTSVVVPSTIDTPQNRNAMPKSNFENWVKPESIADAIYFYCTEEAAVIREPVIKVYNNA